MEMWWGPEIAKLNSWLRQSKNNIFSPTEKKNFTLRIGRLFVEKFSAWTKVSGCDDFS